MFDVIIIYYTIVHNTFYSCINLNLIVSYKSENLTLRPSILTSLLQNMWFRPQFSTLVPFSHLGAFLKGYRPAFFSNKGRNLKTPTVDNVCPYIQNMASEMMWETLLKIWATKNGIFFSHKIFFKILLQLYATILGFPQSL